MSQTSDYFRWRTFHKISFWAPSALSTHHRGSCSALVCLQDTVRHDDHLLTACEIRDSDVSFEFFSIKEEKQTLKMLKCFCCCCRRCRCCCCRCRSLCMDSDVLICISRVTKALRHQPVSECESGARPLNAQPISKLNKFISQQPATQWSWMALLSRASTTIATTYAIVISLSFAVFSLLFFLIKIFQQRNSNRHKFIARNPEPTTSSKSYTLRVKCQFNKPKL